MDAMKCGALIKEIRQSRNMTQEDLAQEVHVSRTAVSKWERGLSMPDISILEPLADTLGISVTELMKGERINEIESETESNYRILSKGAKRELFSMRWKTIWITAAVLAIVLFIIDLGIIYTPKPPVLTLQNGDGNTAVYHTSNGYWAITEYWQKNGKLKVTTFTGDADVRDSNLYLNIYKNEGLGISTNMESVSQDLNEKMGPVIAMSWIDTIKIDGQEQIIGADINHSLNMDLHDALKDTKNDFCFVTAAMKN